VLYTGLRFRIARHRKKHCKTAKYSTDLMILCISALFEIIAPPLPEKDYCLQDQLSESQKITYQSCLRLFGLFFTSHQSCSPLHTFFQVKNILKNTRQSLATYFFRFT